MEIPQKFLRTTCIQKQIREKIVVKGDVKPPTHTGRDCECPKKLHRSRRTGGGDLGLEDFETHKYLYGMVHIHGIKWKHV